MKFIKDHPNWTAVIVLALLVSCFVCTSLGTYAATHTQQLSDSLANQLGYEVLAKEWPEATPTPTAIARGGEEPTPQPNPGAEELVRIATYRPGDLAWSADTNTAGYGLQPVGSLDVQLPYLAETWGPDGGVIFVGEPGTVTWISGHYGGTGWYVDPSANLAELAAQHAANIQARDGQRPEVAILPESSFSLLSCYQTEPAESARKCAEVGSVTKAIATPTVEATEEATEVTVTEGEFPGAVKGPAIIQWWDGGANCGVFALEEGSFKYGLNGHYWRLNSVAALQERYPAHKVEFLAGNTGCVEGRPSN